jgi:hypothetical protein
MRLNPVQRGDVQTLNFLEVSVPRSSNLGEELGQRSTDIDFERLKGVEKWRKPFDQILGKDGKVLVRERIYLR